MAESIQVFLRKGPATSKDIQIATQKSQAAVSRQLRTMADQVVKIACGRSPLYALTCPTFGAGDRFDILRIDQHGNVTRLAYLRPLLHGGFFVEALPVTPKLLLGDAGNGLFDDLPFFLQDLRPQGFLGRNIAKKLAEELHYFPSDPRRWKPDQLGRYLIANVEILTSNLIFSLVDFAQLRNPIVSCKRADYPELAKAAMGGQSYGSSAGGEQPKFTTFCEESQSHVIVKFSPIGSGEVVQRWRDLLVTEHCANRALKQCNIAAAETQLLECEGRLFLESQRFDRWGQWGRLSMLSLEAIDAEFYGAGDGSWPDIADHLYRRGLISAEDKRSMEVLYWFGRLIHNTDMHLGNVSLAMQEDAFKLLPIYDMCSMGFAPKGGEVAPYRFDTPDPHIFSKNFHEDTWRTTDWAVSFFWENLKKDKFASSALKSAAFKRSNTDVVYVNT